MPKLKKKKNWRLYGYAKYLPTVSFSTKPAFLLTNNFVHHRLNFRWYPSQYTTVAIDLRNRLYYGEEVKLPTDFASQLDADTGLVDLSFVLMDKPGAVFHSAFDRVYVNYSKNKWDITLGRQRINWGVNYLWNSNDLFNAFNFLDFDYEERPGSDAVRVVYYPSGLSSMEVAIAPGRNLDQTIAAGLYKFNKWQYDFQFLGGLYLTDIAIGTGWAGNIKNAGFKGEATYFHPRENLADTSGVLSLSVSSDYLLSSGVYLNGGALYNSRGITEGPVDAANTQFLGALSPKNLMPTRYSFFFQGSKEISPVIGSSMAVIYSPAGHLLILSPNFSYSIKENWDLNLIAQSLLGKQPDGFQHIGSGVFFRIKFSYGS